MCKKWLGNFQKYHHIYMVVAVGEPYDEGINGYGDVMKKVKEMWK